jgi:hypothetical protein
MKIINVTVFRTFNYGALLQAYALQRKLIDLGYSCYILNYRPKENEKRFKKIFQKSNNIKELVYNIIALIKFNESKSKISNANLFCSRYLVLTKKYETYDEILRDKPEANIFICGSDQIWNPKIHGLSPLYFLDFVDSNKSIKASFAASIGENYLEEKYKDRVEKFLDEFHHISVREDKAKDILSYTGRDIQVISDPVFLLNKNEWINLSKPTSIKEKYILCYFLYQPKFLNNFLKYIKNKTGYKIISVTPEPFSKLYHDKLIRDVGPDGFLGLLANAEIVITSSFHGTALSILLEKEFYSIISQTRGSRIINLLKNTKLENREITEQNMFTDLNDKIDYVETNKLINNMRGMSLSYINELLQSASKD